MAYTRLNPQVKTTVKQSSSVTINPGATVYIDLGNYVNADYPGYVPVAVVFNFSGQNTSGLVQSGIQTNGTYIWARVYNAHTATMTGSLSATVYWMKA